MKLYLFFKNLDLVTPDKAAWGPAREKLLLFVSLSNYYFP